MAANRHKQTLRLKKVYQRLSRKVYPKDKNVRRMIQLDELWDSYSRWLDSLWVEMYAKGYDPHKNKEDPAFDSDFAKVWNIRALQDKVSAKISRLEVKSGVSREEAQVKMMLANQGRLSTSF